MRLRQAIKIVGRMKHGPRENLASRVIWRHRHSRQYRRMMLCLWNGYGGDRQ